MYCVASIIYNTRSELVSLAHSLHLIVAVDLVTGTIIIVSIQTVHHICYHYYEYK